MRRVLAAVAALTFLCSARAQEAAKPPPSVIDRFHFDTTYEHGRLLTLKTPRGITKYEYAPSGKLSRKILPTGITIDYFHDRDGKLVETRFSNGLVRTRYYDRNGKLSKIIGSDGYVLTVTGAGQSRSVVVTGPNNYHFDMTPIIQKGRTSYAAMMGKSRPHAMLADSGGGGGCSGSWWGEAGCDWYDGGDFGGSGSYDDGWGAGADEWNDNDDVAADWGVGNGEGEYGDDPWYGGAGPGSMDSDPLLPSPGDYNYMRCMQSNCENQNVDFRAICAREPVQNQEMCYRYTAKYYFKCERECWYASY
ncbi:hypothetical protein [Massilia sp. TSP1-1-2]|uniref:hypothetical protein n=1 Tax=unclassified Massilia TaxID=2609279 RepID=UPI003CF2CF59